jgi:hypothetical protein
MKIAVAAQTLSSSVAAGMIYLRNLNVKQFEKCEQTAEFSNTVNLIKFNTVNSEHYISQDPELLFPLHTFALQLRSGYSYWNNTPSLICYSYCSWNI